VLSFHDHRHCPYVSFTAVLGVNVLQHCVSGQGSWVSNSSVKVLGALSVSAGKTDEGRTPIVFSDAVHHSWSVHNVIRYHCAQHHLFGEWWLSYGVVPMPQHCPSDEA
jgi:hypothetical protein